MSSIESVRVLPPDKISFAAVLENFITLKNEANGLWMNKYYGKGVYWKQFYITMGVE